MIASILLKVALGFLAYVIPVEVTKGANVSLDISVGQEPMVAHVPSLVMAPFAECILVSHARHDVQCSATRANSLNIVGGELGGFRVRRNHVLRLDDAGASPALGPTSFGHRHALREIVEENRLIKAEIVRRCEASVSNLYGDCRRLVRRDIRDVYSGAGEVRSQLRLGGEFSQSHAFSGLVHSTNGGIGPAASLLSTSPAGVGCLFGVTSSEPGGDGRCEKQDEISHPKHYLLASVLGCSLGRFRHSDLLTKIVVIGGLFAVIFGLGFFGGFAVPKRPKLGYALIAAGGGGLLLILAEIATPCSVHVDHERGEPDGQRYSSDSRKV